MAISHPLNESGLVKSFQRHVFLVLFQILTILASMILHIQIVEGAI